MSTTIYDFAHYKDFLVHHMGPKRQRRGLNAALAQALRCQPTFISHVVRGTAELSQEQAEAAGRFFGLQKEDLAFFLLLVQRDRAGSPELRALVHEQIEERLASRAKVGSRVANANALNKVDQARYYSAWHFMAIHIGVTIPELGTRPKLAKFFQLPLAKVNEVVDFLAAKGLLEEDAKGNLRTGQSEIHLGNDSENIVKHHLNWRLRAMESLDRETAQDLHFSSVLSISRADLPRLREILLQSIEKGGELIRKSKEEELCSFTIDLFSLGSAR